MTAVRVNPPMWFGCPFPVGALFLTFAGENPSAYWPGTTWQQVECGRFLVASAGRTEGGTGEASPNDNNAGWYPIGETGGARSVKLTAAQSGVPAHAHGMQNHTHTIALGSHNHQTTGSNTSFLTIAQGDAGKVSRRSIKPGTSTALTNNLHTGGAGVERDVNVSTKDLGSKTSGGPSASNTANNAAAGASSAHENRPPYVAVAMWRRTA